jgi:ATP-dependent Clp protease ATP-binding subunit ClpA
MAIRFVVQARAIVRQAEKEAAEAGSPAIGAEHLLLAMAGEHGIEARDVLAAAGLDRDAIRAALDREFRHSLAAAGVTLAPGDLPAASRDPNRRAHMAASGKLVLERALKAAAGRGQIQPGHLLLGVLAAQVGTVPRALALAAVDRGDLAARTRQALERGQP